MTLSLIVGQTAEWTRRIEPRHVDLYREITGDANPLHFDEAFAGATRFEGLIVHGGITAGALNALVAERLPGPGSVFIKQELEYVGPARVGDTLTATGTVVWVHETKPVCRLEVTVKARADDSLAERECLRGTCVVYRARPAS